MIKIFGLRILTKKEYNELNDCWLLINYKKIDKTFEGKDKK